MADKILEKIRRGREFLHHVAGRVALAMYLTTYIMTTLSFFVLNYYLFCSYENGQGQMWKLVSKEVYILLHNMSCMPTVSWSCRPSKESLHQSQH